MDKSILIIGGGMFLLGSSFFLISLFLIIRKKLKLKRFVQTTGVVTHVEERLGMRQPHGSARSTLYKPTVRFQTADGQITEFTPKTSNNWSNYKVGEQIPVYYDPQKTEKPLFGTPFKMWFGLVVFGLVGGFFAFVGIFFTLFSLI
jgi:hypothetical protein